MVARFDVHRNIGWRREAIPFAVNVQLSLSFCAQNQVFTIEGIDVLLHPLELVSVVLTQLGEKVASLSGEGELIANAIDERLTRS